VGNISVITPVAAAASVVTVILSLIFLGEALNKFQAMGISLTILGAILTSFKLNDLLKLRLKNTVAGVEYAIIAMLGWGVLFFIIDILVSELSWLLPILLIKAIGVLYLLIYSGSAKKNISFPKNVALFVILGGLLETVAFISFGVGITFDLTSVVAPIAFAFPVTAIILARIFLKEILEINQKIGVFSVIAGIVLLSI